MALETALALATSLRNTIARARSGDEQLCSACIRDAHELLGKIEHELADAEPDREPVREPADRERRIDTHTNFKPQRPL